MPLKKPYPPTCFYYITFFSFIWLASLNATERDSTDLKLAVNVQQQPDEQLNQGVFAEHFFDYFHEPFALRRHVLTLGYKHQFDFGEVIPKLNIGQNVTSGESFLSAPGFQFEMDAYPVIDPSSYLYLNAGFSGSEIFPKQRYGAEYFRSVFQNWEVSAGFRYLQWDESIFLLTGSVARYLSSWWIAFRPFITLSSSSYRDSYHLTIRRYFNPHREYLYLILSTGDSPDQPVFLIENLGNFSSSKIQVGIIKTVHNQLMGKLGFGFQYEEFQNNTYRNRFESLIGLEYRF